MLMVALTAREFGQSPYEYLYGPPLKLEIDYLAYSLIAEAKEEAQAGSGRQKTPRNSPTAVSEQ